MKKIFLLFVCLLSFEKAICGQTEFTDFVSIGGGCKTPFDDDPLFLIADYSIGSLFHKIDLATLVNARTNLSDIMVGGQLDYYGLNFFGFGLSGGMVISEEKESFFM